MGSSVSLFLTYSRPSTNFLEKETRERQPLPVLKDIKVVPSQSWLCPTCNWRYPRTISECLGAKCRKKKELA
jgi:hypothetical protein